MASRPGGLAAALHEIAGRVPDRDALVWRGRTWSWAEQDDRAGRVAAVLAAHGVGPASEPATERWHSPHDHVALVLHNGNQYLEAMIGAARVRAASVNVNWRYTASEMVEVLDDCRASAIVYHASLAAEVGGAVERMAGAPRLLLHVDDGSGTPPLPGAIDYDGALAAADPRPVASDASGADRYVLYTGGTTGRPKGVLWRQDDFAASCLGVELEPEALAERAARPRRLRALATAPFMHGAAQWNALSTWLAGGTVLVPERTDRFDPDGVIDTWAAEEATSLQLVGDAFARPLVDAIRRRDDVPPLRHLITGGTVLSAPVRRDLTTMIPGVTVVDVLGSSETGRQAVARAGDGIDPGAARFRPEAATVVVAEDRRRVLEPGSDEIGWLATAGRVPLGYLGDRDKTEATFPEIDGRRWAVSGDRARWHADGEIELLGREAVCINTGGEKVFAEEVEMALAHHPAVADCLVAGRPHPRFGSEIVAVVALRPGAEVTLDELRETARPHLAGYKLPRDLVVVDAVKRSPSGKPDYAWARDVATR